ncbi:hypothetical protein BDN70DRAFT_810842 [Pholiota conissans]|uniref:TFIIB-type domain-containing protein n=1 Tax=Pholiota conissans TaxID=109636 RepID=A0A9P6CYC7_9AGAR|nr:hypothetical protein BDN70DRAFT_810842 [Pholiota conissans]
MSVRCRHCDAATVWDDAVGSAICISCGSLADPSQTVLTTSQYGNQNDTTEPSLWNSSASTTLKSLRAGNNWDLAGQGKESRDRRNAYAMADMIKSLAVSFNATGLSPRAITLFTQAKLASNFRWGQKSRSVAAACMAIALRESNRPDSIRDIATLLGVPLTTVTHEFTSITSTLKLSLDLADPSVHISTLHNHVASAMQRHQQISELSNSLTNSLRTLCLRSAARTATSLSQLFARLSTGHDILRLPVPPTACAFFILALEAENRSLLNPLGQLAQFLGARCHVSKSVVMTRYKAIQDEIVNWIQSVSWLDQYEIKNGRAKISKRLIAVRGLKDVIKFQEDIWRKQTQSLLRTDFGFEDDPSEENVLVHSKPPSRKRPRLNHALTQTTQFLLNPRRCTVSSTLSAAAKLSKTATMNMPLATYILTNSPDPLIRRPPTRLQLLAQERGGVEEAQIHDDELFSAGEFEKLLRSEDEITIFMQTSDWTEIENREKSAQSLAHRPPRAGAKRVRVTTPNSEELSPWKKSRVNMEALSHFLAVGGADFHQNAEEDTAVLGLEEVVAKVDLDDYYSQDEEEQDGVAPGIIKTPSPLQRQKHETDTHSRLVDNAGDEVILQDWRPPSPGGTMDIRFEEEYD